MIGKIVAGTVLLLILCFFVAMFVKDRHHNEIYGSDEIEIDLTNHAIFSIAPPNFISSKVRRVFITMEELGRIKGNAEAVEFWLISPTGEMRVRGASGLIIGNSSKKLFELK